MIINIINLIYVIRIKGHLIRFEYIESTTLF